MALKSFREDIRRARLNALKAPKIAPKPAQPIPVVEKPVQSKPVVITDTKTTTIKKEAV
jgi:hypothetical protein